VGGYLIFEIPGFGGKKLIQRIAQRNGRSQELELRESSKRTGTAISQFFKKNWNTGISYKEIWTHNQIPGSDSFLKRNSSKWVYRTGSEVLYKK